MSKKILILICGMLAMSVFVAFDAFAECRPGFIKATIANKGKVQEICIPESGSDHIGGNVVITASCPCWSPTSIDADVRFLQDRTCDWWIDDDEVLAFITRDDPSPTFVATVDWWELWPAERNICTFVDDANSIRIIGLQVSRDEALACLEILVNSDMWAENRCN